VTVYVDDMCDDELGRFRGMRMSHLIADTNEELLAMVDRIGVQRRWIQYPGTHKEHFDIAKTKRTLALAAGAVAITMRQSALMVRNRRLVGALGEPPVRLDASPECENKGTKAH
jgi:hypothetical protein